MESANLLAFFVLIASCIESGILAFWSCLRHFAANDKLLADDHELCWTKTNTRVLCTPLEICGVQYLLVLNT